MTLTAEQERLLNGDDLHMLIFRRMEAMLDNPDEYGLYPTTEFMAGLKSDLLAWAADREHMPEIKGWLYARLIAQRDHCREALADCERKLQHEIKVRLDLATSKRGVGAIAEFRRQAKECRRNAQWGQAVGYERAADFLEAGSSGGVGRSRA